MEHPEANLRRRKSLSGIVGDRRRVRRQRSDAGAASNGLRRSGDAAQPHHRRPARGPGRTAAGRGPAGAPAAAGRSATHRRRRLRTRTHHLRRRRTRTRRLRRRDPNAAPAPPAAPSRAGSHNAAGGFSYVVPAGWKVSDPTQLTYGQALLTKRPPGRSTASRADATDTSVLARPARPEVVRRGRDRQRQGRDPAGVRHGRVLHAVRRHANQPGRAGTLDAAGTCRARSPRTT